MLENAVYSVISPEGCASILWKDPSKVKEAAACLKLTAEDLLGLGVIERIIGEEDGNFDAVYELLRGEIAATLRRNRELPIDELLQRRYDRFRKIGAGK